jgi:hypothetical protein
MLQNKTFGTHTRFAHMVQPGLHSSTVHQSPIIQVTVMILLPTGSSEEARAPRAFSYASRRLSAQYMVNSPFSWRASNWIQ